MGISDVNVIESSVNASITSEGLKGTEKVVNASEPYTFNPFNPDTVILQSKCAKFC